MPGTTGSRTPSAPDRGVCAISPSDLVGYTGNALTRIKELEQRVAELESKIVQTSQLSNLSQQVGWVGGVTYMGTAGWTQTSYGTLIPPAGFYLGNIIPGYSGGLVDSDGNFVLGLADDGTLTGTLTAILSGTALFQMSGGAVAVGPGGTNFTFTTVESKSFAVNNGSSITMESGLYLLTVSSASISRTSTAAASTLTMRVGSPSSGNQDIGNGFFWASGETTASTRYFTGAKPVRFPDDLSNSTITGFASKSGSPTIIAGVSRVGITKIGT